MARLNVIDLQGAAAGEVDVADEVFATEVKEHLLWEVVRSQRAAKRQGTACTKGRGEVSRTKAKMYKQKGTGSARHGSRRVNVFRGGGQVHGPKPRSYAFSVNKKAIAGALRSVLSLRVKQGNLLVVKEFTGEQPKTKILASALQRLSTPKALLVDDADNRWLQVTARNLADARFLADAGLNVYDVLRFPKILISEASLRRLEERLRPRRKALAAASVGDTEGVVG